MTTYVALRELFSSKETGLQGFTSPSGNADAHNGHVLPSPSPPEERSTKKAKTTSSKNRGNVKSGLSKRVRGRLSELPTMPLDIVYEILGHLLPSDLLSLSRVDRTFRNLLMSRSSTSAWRASYRLIPGVPPCPEDMSEPAWAHLLFGGAYCYSCGAKPVTKVLFSLRRRACKSCMKAHLLCASYLPNDVRELFRSVTVPSGSCVHPSKPWCTEHLWDEDVKAFQAELSMVDPKILDSCESTDVAEASFFAFLEKRKKMVTEVKQHTQLCLAWEKDRNADRSAVLSDVKAKRFEDIKARFVKIGYAAEDVAKIRWHREVNMSKPMSDRVWQRVEPLLIPEVNEARDSRFQSVVNECYLKRRDFVVDQFAIFMGTIPPLLLPFLPPFIDFLCNHRGLADAVTLENDPDNVILNEQIHDAMSGIVPELESLKQERASLLRSLLPQDDSHEGMADEDVLALATSMFECVPCHLKTSGLHMLGHRCYSSQRSRNQCPRFNEQGKKSAEMLLEMLGLDKKTTALELDRRGDKFVCWQCPLVTFLVDELYPQRRLVRDWRSCLSHMCVKDHDKPSRWRLVGEEETAGWAWDGDPIYGAYSCMHCPPRVDQRRGFIQWQGLYILQKHLKEEHSKHEPVEGEDFFYDYGTRRTGRTIALKVEPEVDIDAIHDYIFLEAYPVT